MPKIVFTFSIIILFLVTVNISIVNLNRRKRKYLVVSCGIVVSEFEFLSCFFVHFRTNTLGQGKNLLIPTAMDLIELLFF